MYYCFLFLSFCLFQIYKISKVGFLFILLNFSIFNNIIYNYINFLFL